MEDEPKNLKECFEYLDRELDPEDIEKIKSLKNRNETFMFHFGLGMGLRNSLGLWGGSKLAEYLRERDFMIHPDDMSGLILKYYYDWLHGNHRNWKRFDKKKPKKRGFGLDPPDLD